MSLRTTLFTDLAMGSGGCATTHEFICMIPRIPLSVVSVKTTNVPNIKQEGFQIPFKGDTLYVPDLYNVTSGGEWQITLYESAALGVRFEVLMSMLNQMISFKSLFDVYFLPLHFTIPATTITKAKDCYVKDMQSTTYNMESATQHMERTVTLVYNSLEEISTPADSQIVRSMILKGLL